MATFQRRLFGDTKIVVHFLICVFAIASWVDANGIWTQLPLLTERAPEGWLLPSYLTVISQVANIGPLLFLLVSYLAPQTKPKLEKVTSFVIIIFGLAACIMLAFLSEYTSDIGGEKHSTALLVLNFFLGVGDCTSSVSFYAFMSHLKSDYMASLLIGEGLSGLVPAMFALGQGVGEIRCNGTETVKTQPNFSVQVYFIIMAGTMAVCAIAFLALNFCEYCKSEFVHTKDELKNTLLPVKGSSSYGALEHQEHEKGKGEHSSLYISYSEHQNTTYTAYSYNEREVNQSKVTVSTELPTSETIPNKDGDHEHVEGAIRKFLQINNELPLWKFFLFIFLVIIIHAVLSTFLMTIQIYSSLPYGLNTYHLVTTLSLVANPMAGIFALFVTTSRLSVILLTTFLGQVCGAYIIYLASTSPNPPLLGTTEGEVLAVVMWILVTFLLIYAKVCIAAVMRLHGRSALIWVGVATQTGALLGAVIGFLLVNVYTLFVDTPYCK